MAFVGWGTWVRRLAGLVGLVFLVAASSAAASATVTYPVNGQTVALDQSLNLPFQWTMPEGETWPTLYVGDQPGFDPQNNFVPFEQWCGGDAELEYTCNTSGNGPLAAGTHYAVVATSSPNDQELGPDLFSPTVQFTVPYRIGLGCFPYVGCEWPTHAIEWAPFGGDFSPHAFTQFNLWGWTNGPTIEMAYKIEKGRRVLKRGHRIVSVGGDPLSADQYPEHLELIIYGFRGIAKGTPLRLKVTLTSGTASLAKTYRIHAGAGPKYGVTATAGLS